MSDKELLIRVDELSKKKVFLVSHREEKNLAEPPTYSGILLGYLNKQFEPSTHFIYIVSRQSKDFPYVKVNLASENLITYGRDVIGSSILEHNIKKENQLVIILSCLGDPIGMGRTRYGPDLITQDKVTITTLIDVGSFIRNESLSKLTF